jgi:NAD(P)-dependent dehydrogenase (short-subunit alcohol dehydrogenase family)/translation elongation factor P/translation initiation factor 5A
MQLASTRAIVTGGVSGLGLAVHDTSSPTAPRSRCSTSTTTRAPPPSPNSAKRTPATGAPTSPTKPACRPNVAAAKDFLGGLNATSTAPASSARAACSGKEGPMPLSQFQATVMVNLVGSYNVAKAAANLMQHNEAGVDGERGIIVNTASVAAYEGQIGQAAYSASKGGVVGMTLPMARELARFGIRVMTVAPGIFWTPMVDGMPDSVQQSLAARFRSRRAWASRKNSRTSSRTSCRTPISTARPSASTAPRASHRSDPMKAYDIKKGNVVEHNNGVYQVRDIERSSPQGRGGNVRFRFTMYSIPGGNKLDASFDGDDDLREVDMSRRQATYSYKDGEAFVFLDDEDYTPYTLDADAVGDWPATSSTNSPAATCS